MRIVGTNVLFHFVYKNMGASDDIMNKALH